MSQMIEIAIPDGMTLISNDNEKLNIQHMSENFIRNKISKRTRQTNILEPCNLVRPDKSRKRKRETSLNCGNDKDNDDSGVPHIQTSSEINATKPIKPMKSLKRKRETSSNCSNDRDNKDSAFHKEKCVICWSKMQSGVIFHSFNDVCDSFCIGCILILKERKLPCPMCRKNFTIVFSSAYKI